MKNLASRDQGSREALLAGVEVMLSGVRSLPEQLLTHLELGGEVAARLLDPAQTPERPQRLALSGLGGSAFPGELLELITASLGARCPVSRDYEPLTDGLSAPQLTLACSFSGNTEETLAAFDAAVALKRPVVAICTGGALEQRALKAGAPLIKLEKPSPTFQPRAATGMFIAVIGALLEDLGLAPGARERIKRAARELKALMSDPQLPAEAQAICERLTGKVPVFYAPHPFAPVAQVSKIKINENAKSPAFWNALPELNHNEMVGYTRLHQPFVAVFLSDPQGWARVQTRTKRSLETLTRYGVDTLEVPIKAGEEPLARALATLYLFDLVSCELAVNAGLDPNPVVMIEEFKAALGPFMGVEKP